MKKIQNIIQSPLIKGSSTIFLGTFTAYFFHYVFNLILGRTLSVGEYGLAYSLISIVAISAVFQTSLGNIFARYSAMFHASNRLGKYFPLLRVGFLFMTSLSLVMWIVLVVRFGSVSSSLEIESGLFIVITFITVTLSLYYAIVYGILQGMLRFGILGLLNFISGFSKILLGILFLLTLGLSVQNALIAVLISILTPFLLALFLVYRKIIKSGETGEEGYGMSKEFRNYSISFLLSVVGITLISHGDVVLVRYFMGSELSGYYSALSLMGKSIFYLTLPLQFVFFPLIAYKKEKNENLLGTTILAIFLVVAVTGVPAIIYSLFPGFIISLFFPREEYQILTEYLGSFSIFIVIFSIAYLFNNYFLSIGRTKIFAVNCISAILFVVLMSLIPPSINSAITVLYVIAIVLLAAYLVYYLSFNKKNGKI